MGKSLRVKDVVGDKETDAAVKIEEQTQRQTPVKKGADLAIRAMLADAFSRRKVGLDETKELPASTPQKAPTPYIYLRMAIMFIVIFIIVLSAFYFLRGYELYPVLIVIIAVAIPSVVAIFFYELDTSKRLTLYNVLLIFSVVCVCSMAVDYIGETFIYSDDGGITPYGAMALGLIECAIVFLLCTGFIYRLKISDSITGMLIGAILGAGFAIGDNVMRCFRDSFAETQYAPLVKMLIFDETIVTTFNNVVKDSLMDCLLHSLDRVLLGVVFGSVITKCKTNPYKEKFIYIILFLVTVSGWGFATLWRIQFSKMIGILFEYILRVIITVAIILIAGASIRSGLKENEYK